MSTDPALLHRLAERSWHTPMIAGHAKIPGGEPLRPFLHSFSGGGVDDAATRHVFQHVEYLGALVFRLKHGPDDIRTVETPDYDFRLAESEVLDDIRSEEHTSELQSRENIVCRLLLEKKNA